MTSEDLPEKLQARAKELEIPQAALDNSHDLTNKELTEKEEKNPPMWKALLQLRVLLPYISRLVPLLDGGAHQATAQTHELRHDLLEVQSDHKDLGLQMQDQLVQMKRVEEQLERLREATERNTQVQQELIEDLKSFRATIKVLAAFGLLLLFANSGLLVYLLVRLRH